ncbi:hypothetical protein [Desulfuromonas sp.]|uniref:hypothetical protein n=1 Tax=Desulfuromonas sp. TaxID=892 RepID=UPI0025BFA8F6|nr:hypothetical protein [Desulfuromonas sp.]
MRALKVVFRASVVLTFAVVFLIGAWAVLALVSAAVGSGGVMELIKGWFGAVGG